MKTGTKERKGLSAPTVKSNADYSECPTCGKGKKFFANDRSFASHVSKCAKKNGKKAPTKKQKKAAKKARRKAKAAPKNGTANGGESLLSQIKSRSDWFAANTGTVEEFYKGMRVKFYHEGREVHGTVTKKPARGQRVSVLDDETGGVWRCPGQNLRLSDKPAPKGTDLKKGDRVEWRDKKGALCFGTVKSVNKVSQRVTVIHDGGEYRTVAGAHVFNLTQKEAPKDEPSLMDAYEVRKFKEFKHGHGDSRTFFCEVWKDGKPVLTVENDGWGGSNLVNVHRKCDDKNAVDEFHAAARDWVKKAVKVAGPNTHGADESWVEWYQFDRPYAVTAYDALKWLRDMYADWEGTADILCPACEGKKQDTGICWTCKGTHKVTKAIADKHAANEGQNHNKPRAMFKGQNESK